jgi:hypothetical protein
MSSFGSIPGLGLMNQLVGSPDQQRANLAAMTPSSLPPIALGSGGGAGAAGAVGGGGLAGGGGLSGLLGQVGKFVTGDYNPQNIMLDAIAPGARDKVPGWVNLLQNTKFSASGPGGGVGFNGSQMGGGNNAAMMAGLTGQVMGSNTGAAPTVKNASTTTDLSMPTSSGVAGMTNAYRQVQPISYDPLSSVAGIRPIPMMGMV